MTTGVEARKLPLVQPSRGRTPYVAAARGDVSTLSERERAIRASFRVALVSMPFQWVRTPSIQLGLLSAVTESHGFPTQTFHLTLEFASRVGLGVYEELSTVRSMVMGDWFFSKEAFREEAPDQDARFLTDFAGEVAEQFGRDAPSGSPTLALRTKLAALRIRDEVVPAFLNAMMSEIDWSRFQVVGFSSVFQQTVASMALARRIKEAFPHVRIVFGGSNFDDEMGLEHFRATPWIDHAVVGEGDVALPELLVALSEDKPTDRIPGVASRLGGDVVFGGKQRLLEDLDQLPTPRYDEYFSRAESLGILPRTRVRPTPLPFESARGCWWGEKHHCTFCGLNDDGMRFRSKSPGRVAHELSELARSYGALTFTAVDNIVDARYLKELFPHFVEGGKDYKFFYEVKANLTREQIKALKQAGVIEIQPGIESLSTRVLRLMRKGTTGIQNVNALRWVTYYGLSAGWNMLWGFPGETAEDYAEQARLVRSLVHLWPPQATGVRIRMDRFSPLFVERTAFPVEFMRPDASYAYVYPKKVDLTKIAAFWEYQLTTRLDDSAYAALAAALRAWRAAWDAAGALPRVSSIDGSQMGEARKPTRQKPALTFSYSDDFLQIVDARELERVAHTFEGPLARLYKAAVDRPVTPARAVELSGVTVPVKSVERALDEFCERRLMMRDGGKFLALALPATQGR